MTPKQPRFLFPLLVLLLAGPAILAQREMNHWYFSSESGMDFSNGNPVFVLGKITVLEGAASISDNNGRLVFYTDGLTVWNRNHERMGLGSGLHGGSGSTSQSSLIVPKTPDGKQYYIFTADAESGGWGLQYSIVDMSYANGNGDLIVKNFPLFLPICEKITAVRHCNKKDFWLITHRLVSDAYYAFHVSDTGVSRVPVISHTGSFIPSDFSNRFATGYLRASPDGSRLVAAHGGIGVELMDFDNSTGVVSNAREIFGNANALPYGVEFSESGKKLYVSVTNYRNEQNATWYSGLFQFDLSLPGITDIINSKFQLSQYAQGNQLGALQRGPNGKIYMSQYQKHYLSVINFPEIAGAGCDFVNDGFTLQSPSGGMFSLPNFINNFKPSIDSFFVSPDACVNTPVQFSYTPPPNVRSVLWDFGDPASGSLNHSTELYPTHTFQEQRTYTVRLIKYTACGADTLTRDVTTSGGLYVNLGNDTSICEKSTVSLSSHSQGANSFLWQDGSNAPTYLASKPGLYWVQVTSGSNGCVVRDSITLTGIPLPKINLGADTAICVGQALTLNAGNAGATYQWYNNTTGQTLMVNQAGTYWVQVTANECASRDSIRVTIEQKPVFSLGPDTAVCLDKLWVLNPKYPGNGYLWQDGSTQATYAVRSEGLYYVDVTNNCGTTRDSIKLSKGVCDLYVPNAFSPNNDRHNEMFKIIGGDQVTNFSLMIYNRWGQLIFSTKDKRQGWDGKFKGVNCPAGTYVYLLQFTNPHNLAAQTLRGTLLLLR